MIVANQSWKVELFDNVYQPFKGNLLECFNQFCTKLKDIPRNRIKEFVYPLVKSTGMKATQLYDKYLSKKKLPTPAHWAYMPKLLNHCGFRLSPILDKALFKLSARLVFLNLELHDLRFFFDVHTEKDVASCVVQYYLNGKNPPEEIVQRIQKYFSAYPEARAEEKHDVDTFFFNAENIDVQLAEFTESSEGGETLDEEQPFVAPGPEESPRTNDIKSLQQNSPFGDFDACWQAYAKRLDPEQKKEILTFTKSEKGRSIGANQRTTKRIEAAIEGAVDFSATALFIIHYFVEKYFEYRTVGRYNELDTQLIRAYCEGVITFEDTYARAGVTLNIVSKQAFMNELCTGAAVGRSSPDAHRLREAAEKLLKESVVETPKKKEDHAPVTSPVRVKKSTQVDSVALHRKSPDPGNISFSGIQFDERINTVIRLDENVAHVDFTLSGSFSCKPSEMHLMLSQLKKHFIAKKE